MTELEKILSTRDLDSKEAESLICSIMTGKLVEAEIANCLSALAQKGESGLEIAVFARCMRSFAVDWPSEQISQQPAIGELCDTCGTGGDGSSSLNVSTLSAIILASLGIPVAKHGNRAVSSKSGSADLLESLGISLELSKEETKSCLDAVGITFLYAPNWHPAMKYAAPARKSLKIRTIFNLLGPITNPAPVKYQLLGVFDKRFQEVIAEALAQLGREAYVICSDDGLDEVSWAAPSYFIRTGSGKIQERGELSPEDFGFTRHAYKDLEITGIEEAKERSLNFLKGDGSLAENHAIAMNAALIYSLMRGLELKKAAQICLGAIKDGNGFKLLEAWRSFVRSV